MLRVDSSPLINQNISFRQQERKAYYLWSLARKYDLLELSEKALLEQNNFNEEKLKNLYESLMKKIRVAIKIDDYGKSTNPIPGWEKKYVLLRYVNPVFEIGEKCQLIITTQFRGSRLRNPDKLRFTTDQLLKNDEVSVDCVREEFEKLVTMYRECKKSIKGATKKEFYESETLKVLYSPEFKVKPEKTEKGYVTTIINKKTGKPENVYINISYFQNNTRGEITLSKSRDKTKDIPARIVGDNEDMIEELQLGLLKFNFNGSEFKDVTVGQLPSEFSGIGYRLIQALLEHSLRNGIERIIFDCEPKFFHFYVKSGLRVNPHEDKLLSEDDNFFNIMYKQCDDYGLSREKLKNELKKRSRNGESGFGQNEILATFYRLLYQKSKMLLFGSDYIPLEFTEKSKQEWLERIKLQPILDTTIAD